TTNPIRVTQWAMSSFPICFNTVWIMAMMMPIPAIWKMALTPTFMIPAPHVSCSVQDHGDQRATEKPAAFPHFLVSALLLRGFRFQRFQLFHGKAQVPDLVIPVRGAKGVAQGKHDLLLCIFHGGQFPDAVQRRPPRFGRGHAVPFEADRRR